MLEVYFERHTRLLWPRSLPVLRYSRHWRVALTRSTHIWILLLLTCHSANLTAQATAEVGLVPPSLPIDPNYFGIHIHAPAQDTWPQIPFTGWRLWDSTGTVWYNLEPRRGQWNFTQLDKDVGLASEHHVQLLLTLGQTPAWATSRPADPPLWRPGAAAPPRDEEDWKNYIRTVCLRYLGHIHVYEIWNEPDVRDSYTGTLEQLVTLAKDAYYTIHEIDPTAIVVSPSIEGDFGVRWFDTFLELGGGAYADVIGYHFYTHGPPETAIKTMLQVKDSMRKHGIKKALWNTESGYGAGIVCTIAQSPSNSEDVTPQASYLLPYVMREYVLNWAAGVSRLYWYAWDGCKKGDGYVQSERKGPAAYGYAAVEHWLVGSVMQECVPDVTSTWTCMLMRSGRKEWIVWNPDKSTTISLPITWQVTHMETLAPSGQTVVKGLDSTRVVTVTDIPTLLQ